MSVQFGIFDHLDQKPESPSTTLADRLSFVRSAEAAGFRGYHLAEHHGTPLGMASSPSVFLAAVAQATSKIRLGPLVYLLPLYDPLRLLEEICLLDHLSGGRLEVGIGRGISPIELGFFGVESEETAAISDEALQVLRIGLSQDRLSFEGQYFSYKDVPIPLSPQQKSIPFWTASMSEDGLTAAAKAGMHTASLGNAQMIQDAIATYKNAALSLSDEALSKPSGSGDPLHGMYRIVVVAATDEEAERIARPAYLNWFSKLIKLWREHGVEAPMLGPLDKFEVATEIGMAVHGSPERVVDLLATQVQQSGANYVLAQMAFGDISHTDEMRSLELMAERVLPAFA